MGPESRELLLDMQKAAGQIVKFTIGKTLAEYLADQQLRWSVERGFEIIGEALTQIQKREPEVAEQISDHRKIVSFRNVLIHGYRSVNSSLTWDIVQQDLPLLVEQLDALLA